MAKEELPNFEVIYNKYKQKIFALVYRLMNDISEAEDLTQEIFTRAYKNYNKFRYESAVYSWLYRIGINLCGERIRYIVRQKKKTTGNLISLDQKSFDKNGKEISRQISDPSSQTPLEILEKEDIRLKIKEAIELLPDKYNQIIILREIEDLPYEEIARILNISSEVVGVRLIRARKMLKEKLKNIL